MRKADATWLAFDVQNLGTGADHVRSRVVGSRLVGRTVAMLAGIEKADRLEDDAQSDEVNTAEVTTPDWEANGGKPKVNQDKETLTPASKSLQQVFADLHAQASGQSRPLATGGLATPPTFHTVVKANVSGPSDAELESMPAADAVQHLLERQRAAIRQARGLV